jgi:hypothetical protein
MLFTGLIGSLLKLGQILQLPARRVEEFIIKPVNDLPEMILIDKFVYAGRRKLLQKVNLHLLLIFW